MRRKGHVALIGVSSAVASAPFMATGRVGEQPDRAADDAARRGARGGPLPRHPDPPPAEADRPAQPVAQAHRRQALPRGDRAARRRADPARPRARAHDDGDQGRERRRAGGGRAGRRAGRRSAARAPAAMRFTRSPRTARLRADRHPPRLCDRARSSRRRGSPIRSTGRDSNRPATIPPLPCQRLRRAERRSRGRAASVRHHNPSISRADCLHEIVEDGRIARMQTHATVRGRATEILQVVRPVHRVPPLKKIECGIGELSYFREYHILAMRTGR